MNLRVRLFNNSFFSYRQTSLFFAFVDTNLELNSHGQQVLHLLSFHINREGK